MRTYLEITSGKNSDSLIESRAILNAKTEKKKRKNKQVREQILKTSLPHTLHLINQHPLPTY